MYPFTSDPLSVSEQVPISLGRWDTGIEDYSVRLTVCIWEIVP